MEQRVQLDAEKELNVNFYANGECQVKHGNGVSNIPISHFSYSERNDRESNGEVS